MRLRRVLPLIVLALIVLASLAGAASAAPKKEAFQATWVNGMDVILDPLDPWCSSETGNAYHERCGGLKFDLVECTNPKVCGTLEFLEHSFNYTPGSVGMQVKIRIDVAPDAYWEGTGSNIRRHQLWLGDPMDVVIARFEGRGYGKIEGWLIKADHWYTPGAPPPFPDPTIPFKVLIGGEIIQTGQS